jgi:hypothetical protein
MSWIEIGLLVVSVLFAGVATAQFLLLRRRGREQRRDGEQMREARALLDAARERFDGLERELAAATELAAAASAAASDAQARAAEAAAGPAPEPAEGAVPAQAVAIWAANREALFAAIEAAKAQADAESAATLQRVCGALDAAFGADPASDAPKAAEPAAAGGTDAGARERELKQLVIKFTHNARNMLSHIRALEREKEALLALLAQHGLAAGAPAPDPGQAATAEVVPARNAA